MTKPIPAMLLFASFLSSCASITKSDKQIVAFVWEGKRDKSVKLRTHDGAFELSDGIGMVAMSRSKEDVPIWIECGGKTNPIVMKSKIDWEKGILGNLIFGGIPGWIGDFTGDKGFDFVSPQRLEQYCK